VELSKFEELVVAHAFRTEPPGKHAARSAIRHLERAFKLADEMPEVAVFLAITAEEEAATAVIHAVKRRGYRGAKALNPWKHLHKAALHPFILAICKRIEAFPMLREPRLVFDTEHSPDDIERLRLRFTISDANGEDVWAFPLPPLYLSIKCNGILHDFRFELDSLAREKNAASARKYVEGLANRRNRVLYAADVGIPNVKVAAKFFEYRKQVVFSHLCVYILVEQFSSREQPFAQQALDAYLSILKRTTI
jgi:hypothetical protein